MTMTGKNWRAEVQYSEKNVAVPLCLPLVSGLTSGLRGESSATDRPSRWHGLTHYHKSDLHLVSVRTAQ
jgi:hypothetical protein